MNISPVRKKIFVFLTIILGTALGLVAVELIARLEGSYARHLAAIARRNEFGRQSPIPPPPVSAEKIIEIVVMGDSFSNPRVAGAGKAWPTVLQEMLNDRYGSDAIRFAVRNQARGGATLTSDPAQAHLPPMNHPHPGHLEMLSASLGVPNREVDLALHQLFINDFIAPWYRAASSIPAYSGSGSYIVDDLTFHSWFYVRRFFADYPLLEDSYVGWLKRFGSLDHQHWQLVEKDYLKITNLAAEHDVLLVTFLLPAQIWRQSEYPLDQLHESVRATLEPHASHYLDLLPSLQSRIDSGYDHWLFPDFPDAHADVYTNTIYAELLLAYLESSGVVGELMARKQGM